MHFQYLTEELEDRELFWADTLTINNEHDQTMTMTVNKTKTNTTSLKIYLTGAVLHSCNVS